MGGVMPTVTSHLMLLSPKGERNMRREGHEDDSILGNASLGRFLDAIPGDV
jgi:hypothetical protein